LTEGKIVRGVVKNITEYGAFIDLGGIDGLLHKTDMSWGRINHPSELFAVGNDVEVVVLKFDPDKERVSLGYKQRSADPWEAVEDDRREVPRGRPDRREGSEADGLRGLHRGRRGYRRPRPHLRHVLDQASQAPLRDAQEGGRGRGGHSENRLREPKAFPRYQ